MRPKARIATPLILAALAVGLGFARARILGLAFLWVSFTLAGPWLTGRAPGSGPRRR
jgi:hypothetical protein